MPLWPQRHTAFPELQPHFGRVFESVLDDPRLFKSIKKHTESIIKYWRWIERNLHKVSASRERREANQIERQRLLIDSTTYTLERLIETPQLAANNSRNVFETIADDKEVISEEEESMHSIVIYSAQISQTMYPSPPRIANSRNLNKQEKKEASSFIEARGEAMRKIYLEEGEDFSNSPFGNREDRHSIIHFDERDDINAYLGRSHITFLEEISLNGGWRDHQPSATFQQVFGGVIFDREPNVNQISYNGLIRHAEIIANRAVQVEKCLSQVSMFLSDLNNETMPDSGRQ